MKSYIFLLFSFESRNRFKIMKGIQKEEQREIPNRCKRKRKQAIIQFNLRVLYKEKVREQKSDPEYKKRKIHERGIEKSMKESENLKKIVPIISKP